VESNQKTSDSLFRLSQGAPLYDVYHSAVGNIVLINVAHIVDRLPPNLARGHELDVIEPLIRIQPRRFGLSPQPGDARWPALYEARANKPLFRGAIQTAAVRNHFA